MEKSRVSSGTKTHPLELEAIENDGEFHVIVSDNGVTGYDETVVLGFSKDRNTAIRKAIANANRISQALIAFLD